MTTALISLGANIAAEGRAGGGGRADTGSDAGPLAGTLEQALDMLGARAGIAVAARSRWWRTPAHPPGSGPDFVNGAARLETGLAPAALLAALLEVEAALGRRRPARWAPRVCDLDLLAVGDMVLPDRATAGRWMALDLGEAQRLSPPRLILPHPRMHERGFVLVPLAEVAPGWRHPITGQSVAEMLEALGEAARAGIRPLG